VSGTELSKQSRQKNIETNHREKLSELITQFILFLQKEKRAPHTITSYHHDLILFCNFMEKTKQSNAKFLPIEKQLQRYVAGLHKTNLSRSSIARKVSCFTVFQRFLISQGLNTTILLKRPFYEEKKLHFLSQEAIFQLLDTLDNKTLSMKNRCRDQTILELLYATGARCSELITIKLSDIDFSRRTVLLTDSKQLPRTVSFQERTTRQITHYIATERAKNVVSPYLFLNNRQEQLTCRGVQRTLKLFERILSVPYPITPHTIRHSYAFSLVRAGVDAATVQQLLGLRSGEGVEKYLRNFSGNL
jgi:site-specific recombinase XerD